MPKLLLTVMMLTLVACSNGRVLNDASLLTILRLQYAIPANRLCTMGFTLPTPPLVDAKEFGVNPNAQYDALTKVGLLSRTARTSHLSPFATEKGYVFAVAHRNGRDVQLGARADDGTGIEQHFVKFCYATIEPVAVHNIQREKSDFGLGGSARDTVTADFDYSLSLKPWAQDSTVRRAFPQIDDANTSGVRHGKASFVQNQQRLWIFEAASLSDNG